MTRVIYAWAGLPDMPEVASRLQESIGWNPVVWISYSSQEQQVRTLFPVAVWHDLEEAFIGVPVPGLNTAQPPSLDEALLLRLQPYMPRLLDQMNRFGPPNHFLYDEREAFARRLLTQWREVLVASQADLVFFEEPPNSPYGYSISMLCSALGIRTVYMNAISVPGRALVRENLEDGPLGLREAYAGIAESPEPRTIPDDIVEAVAALTERPEFTHRYMVVQDESDARIRSALPPDSTAARAKWVADKGLKGLNVAKWPLFIRNYRARSNPVSGVWLKKPGLPIGSETFTYSELAAYQRRARDIKSELRDDYMSRCEDPELGSEPYVYFPLHFRPERTSNPDGGVFYDQIIPLALISDALPDGWRIYVKEHPSQLNMTMNGECGRTTAYYDEIAALAGVTFIAPETSSKSLLLASRAAATITGTIAWEAALNRRPAMYFGHPWFMGCPGTTRVTSAEEVAAVLNAPKEHVADADDLERFLAALGVAAFRYYQNAWTLDPQPATPENQLNGLVEAMTWWNANRYAPHGAVGNDDARGPW